MSPLATRAQVSRRPSLINRKSVSISWKVLAGFWLLLVLLATLFQVRFLSVNGIHHDLNATHPKVVYEDVVAQATDRLSYLHDYRTIFMVGFPVSHAQDFESYVARINAKWSPPEPLQSIQWEALDINDSLSYYRSISKSLMSMRDQLDAVNTTNEELLAKGVASLTTVGNNGYIAKVDDPLGFFARWVQKRIPKSTILTTGETLKLYADNYVWAMSFSQAPNDLKGVNPLAFIRSVEDLREIVQEINPEAQVLVRGQPYTSAVIATQNIHDLLAVLIILLIFFGFLAQRWTKSNVLPVLMLLCTVVGLIGAGCASIIFFKEFTLWTLTLGVSFVGLCFMNVAYVSFIHHRHPNVSAQKCLELALPVLCWITLIECISFGVLWFVPIPVWQEFSVFMIAAVISCHITLIVCYPLSQIASDQQSFRNERIDHIGRYWPRLSLKRWQKTPFDILGYTMITLFVISTGFYLLEADQARTQSTEIPLSLQLDNARVEQMLMLPSSQRFFMVSSGSVQETLMNEEALRMGFVQRRFSNMTTTCVSKWLPSNERADHVKKIREELFYRIQKPLNDILGYDIKPNMNTQPPINFDQWYQSNSSGPVRHLWLGEHHGRYSSIVQVAGISEPMIPQLKALGDALSGVIFIDTIETQNLALNDSRFFITGIYLLLVVTSITLSLFHYGLDSWRIVFPPLGGSLGMIAILSWFKIPFSLTSAIALVVVYGVGMSISLAYQTNRDYGAKNTILLFFSAVATLASFGIIGLVDAPFTKCFGLNCTVGILLTCCITFLFRQATQQNDKADWNQRG